ncbi:MAG: cytochrome c3 family protein [Nitrospirota bacterium]|nr:cytochrome c3 family protein [Nitrospirota bacterium]
MKKIVLGIFCIIFAASVTFAVVGGGDIVYKVKHTGDVTFSHDSHIAERGYKCEDCHPSIFAMKKETKKRKMSDLRAKKACGVCHNGKNAFDVGSNCYICHKK